MEKQKLNSDKYSYTSSYGLIVLKTIMLLTLIPYSWNSQLTKNPPENCFLNQWFSSCLLTCNFILHPHPGKHSDHFKFSDWNTSSSSPVLDICQ